MQNLTYFLLLLSIKSHKHSSNFLDVRVILDLLYLLGVYLLLIFPVVFISEQPEKLQMSNNEKQSFQLQKRKKQKTKRKESGRNTNFFHP